MALTSEMKVPISMPLHPSLALLASLAAVALDAAIRKKPYNPEPVTELARILNQRIGPAPERKGAPARMLDPETTGLLAEAVALKSQPPTAESLAVEGAEIAAALQLPLEEHARETLLQLREFALRLSAAAQTWVADDPLFAFISAQL